MVFLEVRFLRTIFVRLPLLTVPRSSRSKVLFKEI